MEITFDYETVQIPLSQGKYALIDRCDYALVKEYTWCTQKTKRGYYAVTTDIKNGIPNRIYMHRLILGITTKVMVDHKNRNGLDNRRENLRLAEGFQNVANSTKYTIKSSKYKGVSWNRIGKIWRAFIYKNRKQFYLGRFKNEEDAAKAYDIAARKLFGEYANTNF